MESVAIPRPRPSSSTWEWRTRARALALQALCVVEAVGDAFIDDLERFLRDDENYADLGWPPDIESRTLAYARHLVRGAWAQRERCDALLHEASPGWTVRRMTGVDRNILRLGVFELRMETETPPAIVINEAVELAHRFGGQETAAFVNGVLDAVRRRLTDPTPEPPPADPPTAEPA